MTATIRPFINKLTYGFSRTDDEALPLEDWIDLQLNPNFMDDPQFEAQLSSFKIPIKYEASKDWPAVDEMRPISYMDRPLKDAWGLTGYSKKYSYQEGGRPVAEMKFFALLRAVYTRWQVHAVMCEFWNNHFSVNGGDFNVGLCLPTFDREVIRKHALGNFQALLEAVAKSPAMLWYLNNKSSKTGGANENYARELFELHTMGRDAYLNTYYNHWKDVPRNGQGMPVGYIDQDVYEAARAFTGWTVADGSVEKFGFPVEVTGEFLYVDAWHDQYQKRVLANEFEPYQPAMTDGLKVLSLVARHPATAKFICKKICTRLVYDDPPEQLVASTAKVWLKNAEKEDQIARVIKHIVTSSAFIKNTKKKTKTPFELLVSYVRATGMEFSPTYDLFSSLDDAGQKLFGQFTPTGYPDNATYWTGTYTMWMRWKLIYALTENRYKTGILDKNILFEDNVFSNEAFVRHWARKLLGTVSESFIVNLLLALKLNPSANMTDEKSARKAIAMIAMSPDFQEK